MTNTQMPVETQEGEAAWLSSFYAWLEAYFGWLFRTLDHIARMKSVRRNTVFRPDWRDTWKYLRQCEWLREQVIVRGVRQIFRGEELVPDGRNLDYDPPADYGGPCPPNPFEMNRRLLALACWLLDPAASIRRRARRIAKREGIDLANPLLGHRSTDAALRAAARHAPACVATLESRNSQIALMVSSARSARPSNHEGVLTHARGPPALSAQSRAPPDCRLPIADCPESASFRERDRIPAIDIPRALHQIAANLGGHT